MNIFKSIKNAVKNLSDNIDAMWDEIYSLDNQEIPMDHGKEGNKPKMIVIKKGPGLGRSESFKKSNT